MHLLHFLPHCLHLHIGSLQGWVVLITHQFGVNGLSQPFSQLISTRPVHVLDEQVASHSPQLWVALQQVRHLFAGFGALGAVTRAGGHHHIVLADVGVVDLVNLNALLINNLLDRLGLRRVDSRHIGFTIFTNNPSHPLGVVDFGDHVHQLPGHIANGSG